MPKRSPKLMIRSTKKYWKYIYVLLGIFLALTGVFCTVFSKIFVNRFIDRYMQLIPGSKIVDMWSKPDVNVTIDFYFFNWTNPEHFHNASVKPKLEELGPYSFIEVPNKEIFKWHPENNTVDYAKKHMYYFDESKSKRGLNDTLVTVNALLLAAASKTRDWSYMKRTVVDMALRLYQNGIVWKKSAEEFFFKGFEDNIVNLLSVFPSSFRSSMGLFVPWDRIGFTYGRNGSTDFLGTHTIGTGVGDMNKFGQLIQWNGKNYSHSLPEQCSAIRGSPGEFQKTNLKKYEPIEYFFTDFCRTVKLDYVDEVMIEGILGYRYMLSPDVFDNGTLNEANKCFCSGECLPFGAMNVTSCWYGIPILISNPHFMNADPYFISQVEGLKPDDKIHNTTAILEPRTGFMLELKGRLQLNFYVQPSSHIKMYQTKRRMLFPAVWFDMQMRISKNSARLLKIINNLLLYCHLLGAGITTLVLTLFLWQPLKKIWYKRYAHHMEINTMADDDDDDDDGCGDNKDVENSKNIHNKESLYGLTTNFPSLLYITNPRLSLPVIVSHLNAEEDEALSSCLGDNQQEQGECDNIAQYVNS